MQLSSAYGATTRRIWTCPQIAYCVAMFNTSLEGSTMTDTMVIGVLAVWGLGWLIWKAALAVQGLEKPQRNWPR